MSIALPTINDLNLAFGSKNISAWSDANNEEDDDLIEDRVILLIQHAADYITGKLSRKFDVASWVVFPSFIKHLVVRRAGVELYRLPRGLVDGNDTGAAIAEIERDIERKLNLVIAGVIELIDLVEAQTSNVPSIHLGITGSRRQDFADFKSIGEPNSEDSGWLEQ